MRAECHDQSESGQYSGERYSKKICPGHAGDQKKPDQGHGHDSTGAQVLPQYSHKQQSPSGKHEDASPNLTISQWVIGQLRQLASECQNQPQLQKLRGLDVGEPDV